MGEVLVAKERLQNKLIVSLIIKDKLFELCKNTTCDTDFLTKCVQLRGLSVSEKNEIVKEPNSFKRNLKFYEIVGRKDVFIFRQVIKAMKGTANEDERVIDILDEEAKIKDTRRQTALY